MKNEVPTLLIGLAVWAAVIGADTPADCRYDDIVGKWTISEGSRRMDASLSCDTLGAIYYTKEFELTYPDTAVDELGNRGTWTLVYNQGFEVNINERSYWAFSYVEGDFDDAVSYCDQTFVGWARDRTVRNWSCFRAAKTQSIAGPKRRKNVGAPRSKERKFQYNMALIEEINRRNTSWTAKAYPEFEKYTEYEMFLRNGGPASHVASPVESATPSEELKARVAEFPTDFDWRDVGGFNYVTPVRDQGACGSCYAFASMASLEARLLIATQGERNEVFSPQDVLECSSLSQGCAGGFNYLIAGRYAQDQGVVDESCNAYRGIDGECSTVGSCARTYVSDYSYVGGYYGGCNEELMIEALVTGGPFPVSYEVYDDFGSYSRGVYVHGESKSTFDPFVIVNHAVLLVGFGVDGASGLKYWTCKNSWGADFGESGYFRIVRGVNNCGIESAGFVPTVIP